MNVRFTPRALAEAKRKKTWWQEHRSASPGLFDEEVAAAIEQIRSTPSIGTIYPAAFEVVVRRLLLPKTQNHLYYTVREDELVVLSVWGAPRARGPKL
jgi:plasmid stabilization system protein ParE